jgi:hypothetical protein
MATDEECIAYAREGVRLAGLTDEPKIRFWRTSALRAVTATAGTSRWRPRGSSRARTRTGWSRSKTCKVVTLPRRPLGQGEAIPLKLRPTGLGSGIDKDRPDYTVY